ncbi:MAG: D-aminoacyl-tRNA deacylase [Bacteroidia bacterium]
MRCVVQRVKKAHVKVENITIGKIEKGLLIFVGFEPSDDINDQNWMINKLINMRIFDDDNGKMNLSVSDIEGQLLVVSQFTLHASTKKGNRPSFIKADKPESAEKKYDDFVLALSKQLEIETGKFGAMMNVSLENDGPVTIIIDSKNKE